MLKLEGKIVLDQKAIDSPNLCDRFAAEDLQKIGNWVWEGYNRDRKSREKWERRTQAAMDLAMQVQKEKSFPWANCSNVVFPLVTIAVLQFHSRAYPTIISGTDVVKCRVNGDDTTGEKTKRAARISRHMSWQCLEEDQAWEGEKDKLLINLPIVGCTFSKSMWDGALNHKVDETVLAQDLVMDYYTKSVETCQRKTHIIPMFRNDIYSRIMKKVFRDVREESWYTQPAIPEATRNSLAKDNRQGLRPQEGDELTPFTTLEQHVVLDLDDDGYAEPYIITIEEKSHCVLRIVTGFDRLEDIQRNKEGQVIEITAMQYFTRYEFIPSPDGGIYGIGFGILLGPLNEATDSLINLLIDAGTMQTAAGGFLGRGAKLRGGTYTFAPFQWQRVDSTGDDLRKSIFPLPTREPSAVLFQLLSLLINYVNRISGATDTMVGENPGQNTPAETSRMMIEQGSKIYNAVFKRIWRAMKGEFKKDFVLNGIFLPVRKTFDKTGTALREDYLSNPDDIAPAADPNITSDSMRIGQAKLLKEAAMQTAGYDRDAVERRYLKAIQVEGIDEIFPGSQKTGVPEDPKLQIAKLKLQGQQMALQADQQQFVMQLQEDQRMNNAEIAKIQAEIANMQATIEGDQANRQIAVMDAVLGMLKSRNEHISKMIDVEIKKLELRRAKIDSDGGDVSGLADTSGDGGISSASLRQATGTEG